jgi:hypothetical protein
MNSIAQKVASLITLQEMDFRGLTSAEPVKYDPEGHDMADHYENDYEGDMAKNQLRTICMHAERLMNMMDDNTNLPEWVQSKITLAKSYIVSASNYLESEAHEYSGKYGHSEEMER